MLSHHAPPKRLLQNFQTRSNVGEEPCLWIYSRSRPPRGVFKVTSESAENGYFAGDPTGRTEKEIERALNERFEGPFNLVLPALSSGLVTHLDTSLVEVCGRYMSNVFLRSKPMREASKTFSMRFNEEFDLRIKDEITLKRYAAKVSLHTGLAASLKVITDTSRNFLTDESQGEKIFFQSATTDFSQLPSNLLKVHWAVCESPNLQLIQSDAAVALLHGAPDRPDKTEYGYGIMRSGSRWYLPISPHFALRASPDYTKSTVLAKKEVEHINEFMIRAAYRSIYSAECEVAIQEAIAEHMYSLRYFEHMFAVNIRQQVDKMINGLLNEDIAAP